MPIGMKLFHLVVIVIYIILFAGCFANAVAPNWVWKTFESWKAKTEPSKAYFLAKRICGIIGMLVIAGIALAPAFLAYFHKS